jgi:hypothetical protein
VQRDAGVGLVLFYANLEWRVEAILVGEELTVLKTLLVPLQK